MGGLVERRGIEPRTSRPLPGVLLYTTLEEMPCPMPFRQRRQGRMDPWSESGRGTLCDDQGDKGALTTSLTVPVLTSSNRIRRGRGEPRCA